MSEKDEEMESREDEKEKETILPAHIARRRYCGRAGGLGQDITDGLFGEYVSKIDDEILAESVINERGTKFEFGIRSDKHKRFMPELKRRLREQRYTTYQGTIANFPSDSCDFLFIAWKPTVWDRWYQFKDEYFGSNKWE